MNSDRKTEKYRDEITPEMLKALCSRISAQTRS